MTKWKRFLKIPLGLFFILAGIGHFTHSDFFVAIMPPYMPAHLFLVYLSGVFEIVLGLMLFIPRLTRVAAWGLIALLIAVFPANLHMALNPELFPEMEPVALWLRLPLQGILIAWVFWYTRPDTGVSAPDEKAEAM